MAEITLFDLDGVLTRGDTMASLVSRRLARHPVRLFSAAPLFLLSLAAHPQSRLRATTNRRLVALALNGLTDGEYTELAIRTGRQLAARRGFAVGQTITLCRHAASRHRTIIVTASERRLARAFLDSVGLPDIELLASEIAFHDRAVTWATHNVGPAKLRGLKSVGVPFSCATFYTDSASDLSLAAAARTTFLVNPDARSRRKMIAVIPNLQVIRW
ncbi:HAD family hydrolase [Arthrobacter bambusae]|uniref:HAD family hydrolase n=1 Tax=Arthrobacter bambusae TaxID=1338426 RepID=UPI002782B6D2|nr:HAD family hydrolase [Arthrobacter bambusae]MDQ0212519.1 phosphatidylglycerophosphatase C [Arthrobacter bambusae]MDQ0235953.1 phosphatidylglycerophosphatase C [Arthrobacter bambusae]